MYGSEKKRFKNETYKKLNIKPTPNKNNRAVLMSKHQHFEKVQGHEWCLRASLKKTKPKQKPPKNPTKKTPKPNFIQTFVLGLN